MSLKSLHFLLVEDDDAHAELVGMALQENGVKTTVDRVRDGEEALAYLRREGDYAEAARPDVILLDLKVPKMDGLEVLASIKEDPTLRRIPVLVMTTSDAEADRARAYYNHANSYLVKPADFEKFHAMIRDMKYYWAAWNNLSEGGGG